jgi:hypothetical protein
MDGELGLWPLALRADLVRAFRPGEPSDREAPFRTLREHDWATKGIPVHTRSGARAAGRVVLFSVLNVDSAICARCGDVSTAVEITKAAARLEASSLFVRLQEALAEHPLQLVSSIAGGELVAAGPFVDLVRQLAMTTAAVQRQRRFAKLASWYHVGRISSVAESYVTIDGGGKQSFVPRNLARAVFRERVGECLAIMNGPVESREMIVRALPGIPLDDERTTTKHSASRARSYSPFARPATGFQRVSAADVAYLRGAPKPIAITIPITIER